MWSAQRNETIHGIWKAPGNYSPSAFLIDGSVTSRLGVHVRVLSISLSISVSLFPLRSLTKSVSPSLSLTISLSLSFSVSVSLSPSSHSLQWDTANVQIKASAAEIPKASPVLKPGVGQTIALHASPGARNVPFLMSTFLVLSALSLSNALLTFFLH